jgi:hypothetical protein
MFLSNGEIFNGGRGIRSGIAGYPVMGIKRPLQASAKFKEISAKALAQRSVWNAPGSYMATGGLLKGKGGSMDDRIKLMASNGEYVVRASAVERVGADFLDMINSGKFIPTVGRPRGRGRIGPVDSAAGSNTNVEYNINVNVAGSNVSADDIAKKVMEALKRKEKANNTHRRMG